ncbi:type II toxin-antitoxin system antitoxin DNA ADP-ribosyl glycohydrolase DarG [Anaerotignum faecicola]
MDVFFYTTGDLLKSEAEALVNTVNCEGYMGKGIAYQFKLRYPENNSDYVKICKRGELKPGNLHYFREGGKIIINFPTKDKWRAKSKMEYIEDGLWELKKLISDLGIKSIAIPPLGSGNGGLNWPEVKKNIELALEDIADTVDIYIFEPSGNNYSLTPRKEPKLSTSAYILMKVKNNLDRFGSMRLQKTCYFIDLFSSIKYFKFKKHKYGPYDHAIDVISKSIKEFQDYHGTTSTKEAEIILYNKIVSESVEKKIAEIMPSLTRACTFVNSVRTNTELECLSTICFLIETNGALFGEEIVTGFKEWSEDKAKRFNEDMIYSGINRLLLEGIIEEGFIGYQIITKTE